MSLPSSTFRRELFDGTLRTFLVVSQAPLWRSAFVCALGYLWPAATTAPLFLIKLAALALFVALALLFPGEFKGDELALARSLRDRAQRRATTVEQTPGEI